jgi:hypothetical protein
VYFISLWFYFCSQYPLLAAQRREDEIILMFFVSFSFPFLYFFSLKVDYRFNRIHTYTHNCDPHEELIEMMAFV